MNQELNLCEILKNCPTGTKLYSPFLGIVSFDGIYEEIASINVINIEGNRYLFGSDGRYIDNNDGEVSLFPSKDNRDWSTFKPKKECFGPKTLKPFDKVLVKDPEEDSPWRIDFFGNFATDVKDYSVCCTRGAYWEFCIPFNDDTAHLVGTTDDAPEYYKWWER